MSTFPISTSHRDSITDEEQALFTLLLLCAFRADAAGAGKVDRRILLGSLPDMTEPAGVPSLVSESGLDEIVAELVNRGYVKREERAGESYYEVTDAGEQVLKENRLTVASDNESVLSRFLPEEEFRHLLDILADLLNVRICIMDENGAFRIGTNGAKELCPVSLEKKVLPVCQCCDLLAARRAREEGPHSYRCHMGLVECIAPFPLASSPGQQGYVFMGRVTPLDLDVDRFIQSWRARGLPAPSRDKLMSIVRNEGKSQDEIAAITRTTVVLSELIGSLLDNLDKYSTKIKTLSDVIEASSGLLGQDQILARIMNAAEAVFRYDGAAIWRMRDGQRLTPIASKNGVPESIPDAHFNVDGDGFVSWIARKREPLLISDVSNHIRWGRAPKAQFRDYITDQGLTSFVGVPLMVENVLIGVFEIEARCRRPFTNFDQELLMTIARVAGVVIRNFTLLEVLTNISKKDNLASLLSTAATEFPSLLGAEYCSILLFDQERKKLVLRATNSRQLEEEVDRAYYDAQKGGLTWHVANSGDTVVLKNGQHSPHYKGHYLEDDYGSGLEDYGFLASPLGTKEGETHGVVRFTKRQGMVFGDRDQRLAKILGTWLSLAIDRMQLEIARQHSELLLRIAEIQNHSSTIEDLLTNVASEMTRAFACGECEIWLAERETGEFQLKGQFGRQETRTVRCLQGDGTFIAEIAEKRQIIRRHEIDDLPAKDSLRSKPLGPGSQLGIPLVDAEELVGVLTLTNNRDHFEGPEGQFSESDETTGRIIATQIASTICLYERREKLSDLLRVVDNLYAKTRDTEAALTHMTENVRIAIPGAWGALYRYEARNNSFIRVAYSAKSGAPPKITNVGHVKTATNAGEPLYVKQARDCQEHKDIINSDDSPEVKAYIDSIGSEYIVPLMVVDRLYGVLYVNKSEADALTIADRQAADDLARRASLLLESDALLKARAKLYDAAFRLQSALRLDEVLQEIVNCIFDIGYDRVRLYLVSADKQVLKSEKQVGLKKEGNVRVFEAGEITFNMIEDASSPSLLAFDAGGPVIFLKEGTEAHATVNSRNTEGIRVHCMKEAPYDEQLERGDVQEWLDFPLIASGRGIGKITVDNKSSKRPFSRVDCETLGLFGQYAAQAIQNAHLTKEREEVFRDISHTLISPLTSIKGYATMLAEDAVKEPGTVREYHEIIARETEHFSILANQILNLSRIEAGVFDLCCEEASLAQIIDEVIGLNRYRFEEKRIEIVKSLKSQIDVLVIDKTAMKEAFQGIVDNAIKFSARYGRIEIITNSDEQNISISVIDEGMGIPTEDKPKIWEKYFRGEKGRQEKISGSGIGLTVTQSIVGKHNGKVLVESTPGKGSTFTIVLPRSRELVERKSYGQDSCC